MGQGNNAAAAAAGGNGARANYAKTGSVPPSSAEGGVYPETTEQSAADTDAARSAEQMASIQAQEKANRLAQLAQEKKEWKIVRFDYFHRLLIAVCLKVATHSYRAQLDAGEQVPLVTQILAYQETYIKVDKPESYFAYFTNLYNRKVPFVFNTLLPAGGDQWLHDNCVFQVGEGRKLDERARKRFANHRLDVSTCYKLSLRINAETEAQRKLMPKGQGQVTEPLIFFRIIQMQMLRIFYHLLVDNKDQDRVGPLVRTIEQSLGVPVENRTVGREPWRRLVDKEGKPHKAGLAGFLEKTVGMLNQAGVNDDTGTLTEDAFAESAAGVFENPKVTGMFSDVMGALSRGDKPKDVMMLVMEKTMTGDLLSSILRPPGADQDEIDEQVAKEQQAKAQEYFNTMTAGMEGWMGENQAEPAATGFEGEEEYGGEGEEDYTHDGDGGEEEYGEEGSTETGEWQN